MGCVGTPQPDPPDVDYFADLIGTRNGVMSDWGVAGRVVNFDPPGGWLWIAELEGAREVVLGLPGTAGFSVDVFGGQSALLRFELLQGDRRLAAVDAIQVMGPVVIQEPTDLCLEVGDALVFGRSAEIGGTFASALPVRNACSEPVSLSTRLRVDGPPFQLIDAPSFLLPGGSGDIVVFYTVPPSGNVSGEILVLETASPRQTLFITLLAFGPQP